MKFVVSRYWQLCDRVEVEATSVDAAIEIAHEMPLDESRGDYVSDSLNSDPSSDVQPLVTGGCNVSAKVYPIAKFKLGRIATTPNAQLQLTQEDILP